jgi:DNA-binding NarL/FixJ family response regulator
MLEPLGLTTRAEAVYRALLRHGPAEECRLAELVDVPPDEVRTVLGELRQLGLAANDAHQPGCWHASSPEVSLASLVVRRHETLLERQRDLDRAQQAVGDLVRLNRTRDAAGGGGLVVTGDADAIARRCGHLARTAEEGVLLLAGACGGPPLDQGSILDLLGRGAGVHAVHERPALQEPPRFEGLRRVAAAGAQVRTLPALPLTLAVYDRREAVVHVCADGADGPAGPEGDGASGGAGRAEGVAAVFVRQPALLAGLVALFELLWERAVPLPPTPEDEPVAARTGEFDDVLVALLAAGFKDESIARHLGISPSTVTRRMARLMELTGTSTRFQLGMQAVRKGWI